MSGAYGRTCVRGTGRRAPPYRGVTFDVRGICTGTGGGQGAGYTRRRELAARMIESGRSSGHPAAARVARALSCETMDKGLSGLTVAGDLWLLGDHRLVCGDATDPLTVALALGGQVPLLMVTDPPYGVSYDPTWRVKVTAAGSKLALGIVANDDRADWREAWKLFPGDIAYVWHGSLSGGPVLQSLEAAGFKARAQIIWDKGRLIISRGHYHWRHEPCWYAVRKGRTARWVGDRKQVTVWLIPHRRSETGHSTQKPVEAMLRPMLNHTVPGEHVYDPFVGSGTSIIAAERSGRICHAIELSPAFCDLAVARWEAETGRQACRVPGAIRRGAP